MMSKRFVLSALLVFSTMMAAMRPSAGVEDFTTAARAVPGFNLLSNTPVLPDVPLLDRNGATVSFDRYKGKVVLLNLWATWCPPCIREMPALNNLQEHFATQDFVVLPIASGRQGRITPETFLKKNGLSSLTTLHDPQSTIMRIFQLETLPSTFLIDRDGKMRGGVIGMAEWDTVQAKALIESLLAQ